MKETVPESPDEPESSDDASQAEDDVEKAIAPSPGATDAGSATPEVLPDADVDMEAPLVDNAEESIQDVDAEVNGSTEISGPLPDANQDGEDRIQTPPPDPPSRRSSLEDPADPIEHADDLPPTPTSNPQEGEDPIEDHGVNMPTTPPPRPLSRPGTARRMKDRMGRIPHPEARPVSASEDQLASQMLAQQAEFEAQAAFDVATKAALLPPIVTPATKAPESVKTTPAVAASDAPKRRGRPPLSEAEKARRAAERKVEKEKKAAEKKAEKQAEKDRKAAEKEEKARQRAEKAQGKKGTKAKPVDQPSPERPGSISVASAVQVEGMLSTPDGGPGVAALVQEASERLARAAKAVPQTPTPRLSNGGKAPESLAKWTTLTTDTRDGDSMIDELRSSSPERGLELETPTGNKTQSARHDAERSEDEEPLAGKTRGKGSQHEERLLDLDATPTQKTVNGNPALSPLFLPSSQNPESQLPLPALPGAPPSGPQGEEDEEDEEDDAEDEPEEEPEPEHEEPVFKEPVFRPAHWGADSRFRRLSDIASQQMFAPQPPSSQPTSRESGAQRRKTMFAALGGNDSDTDSDTSSDSDAEGKKSHIPKARRAGTKPRTSSII